jgi:transcriptional regulator with PAS, ATPase and Fis domain
MSILDKDGNISLVIVNERDVTQINELKEQLKENKMVAETYKEELAERNLLEMKKEQNIITKNERFNQIIRTVLKLARIDASNILLLGESGTGKGLLAKFIHKNSPRNNKPLIQINCAAIPDSLLEAELFGYEKGAFTGASQKGKIGLIEVAHEGILFLDEIAELPFGVQAKILKYLDDHEVMRLGSTKANMADCCIIAATNRDLERLVKEKKFREDLYYRLNTFTISIPPLRERKEDMIELIRYLLATYNKSYQQNKHFSSEALSVLYNYSFPGNVRELKNVIERAVVMCDEDTINESYLKSLVTHNTYVPHGLSEDEWKLNDEVRSVEQEIFKRAMAHCKSTREMADYLGISQSTVVRKMKSMGLSWSRMTEI